MSYHLIHHVVSKMCVCVCVFVLQFCQLFLKRTVLGVSIENDDDWMNMNRMIPLAAEI